MKDHNRLAQAETGQLDVERIAAQIAECKNLDELRDIRDQARAIAAYKRARGASLAAQSDAVEITLRAERQLGRLCKEVTGGKAGGRNVKAKSQPVTLLSDLDITAKQSSRWQKLAAINDAAFDAFVASTRDKGQRLTTVGAVAALSGTRPRKPPEWDASDEATKVFNFLMDTARRWKPADIKELERAVSQALGAIQMRSRK